MSFEVGLVILPFGLIGRGLRKWLFGPSRRRQWSKVETQVFFATGNDHVFTRMEHATLVVSVSHPICDTLGHNVGLAWAIATGHDLGHAPFGHHGERALDAISREFGARFWHEGNSLRFVDLIKTIPGMDGHQHRLNLTYAVRDD